MPRKREGRVYWRERGGERRAYGDFRDFADVGGGQEVLKAKGAKVATTDPDIAAQLASDRVKALEAMRRNKVILGVEKEATLEAFAAHHLLAKAKAGSSTESWMGQTERMLAEALAFFGKDRVLTAIGVSDVRAWAEHLATLPGRRGERLSSTSVRHRL
ncbi:MAG: hypothetical protein Q8N53_17025, partial [Longimicrobiales bacterium]|nr:hypothetical protein [Longimicrobiales bacterium]